MQYHASFVARVRECVIDGNRAYEHQKVIALKKSDLASFIVLRALARADAEGKPKPSQAKVSQYAVQSCLKVTPWHEVERNGSMAIQFEKQEHEAKEVLKNGRKNSASIARPSKLGRTKIAVVAIRGWALEAISSVKDIWMELDYAANENAPSTTEKKSKAARPNSVVDLDFRKKERNRIPDRYKVPTNPTRVSLGRFSQGQKMQRALMFGSQQKGGRYSALARGATGASFAKSLIGSPNLTDFDKKSKPPRVEDKTEKSRRIEEELERRCQFNSRRKTSVFSSPDRKNSPESPYQPSGASGQTSRKRQRSLQSTPDGRESRKRFMTQNIQLHRKALQQSHSSHKGLPRPLISLRRSTRISPDPPISCAAGIVNEGNTCYISAVVQALMCDKDLISRIRERTVPNSLTMPFSNALAAMAKDRDSSTILKPGEIRRAISQHFPQFSSSDQQDAHEFLLRCLDVIAKECAWTDFLESPTHTNYSLVQERKVKCILCGHSSEPRRETLRGLSLDLPGNEDNQRADLSLQDLVTRFFASHEVELNCERCEGSKARSDTNIVLTPRTLVLHVKRFGVDYNSSSKEISLKKISETVRVPDELTIDSVLAIGSMTPKDLDRASPDVLCDPGSIRKVTPIRISDEPDLFSNPASPSGLLMSPAPLKSQRFSQMTQVMSPPETHGSTSKRPRNYESSTSFAKRFKIHGRDSVIAADAETELQEKNSRIASVRRTLQLDDDVIEEYEGASMSVAAVQSSIKHQELVETVMQLGLGRDDAEDVVKASNYDKTRAVGLAMDKLQKLRESRPDLDEALVKHTMTQGSISKGRSTTPEHAVYKLAAVIRHDSDSIESGHYVADVLQSDGQWFCYNDSRVSRLSSRKLQDQEGYLCWYIQQQV